MESASCTVVPDAQESIWSFITTVKCEPVKQEPEWGEPGASEAAAGDLDAAHDVKHEIDIGPELIQEQDIAFSMLFAPNRRARDAPGSSRARPGADSHCNMSHKQQNSSNDPGLITNSQDIAKTQLTIRNKSDLYAHPDEKPVSCTVCNKQFTQPADLNRHAKTHTGENQKKIVGEKPFSCEFCKMKFSKTRYLTKHRRIHTGEKLVCSVCKKQFTNNQNLKTHMNTHTNATQHRCSICEKTYPQESCLIKHMRTHTGEKPYACPDCEERFAYAFSLGSHRARVHNYKQTEAGNTSIVGIQAEEKKHLHVWQLSKDTTIESLTGHVREVLGSEADIDIKQVKPKLEKDYTSFIITVPKERYEELLKPEVWPLNAESAEWIWFRTPAVGTMKDRSQQPGLPRLPWR